MRYRPFGRSGLVISAVSMFAPQAKLRDSERIKLVRGALELGINGFEIEAGDEAGEGALGQALGAVDRNMAVVGLRLGSSGGRGGAAFHPEAIKGAIQGFLSRTRLGRVDYLILDRPRPGEISRDAMAMLDAARRARRLGMVGLAGSPEEVDAYMATGAFQILVAPYNLRSGWAERNRMKTALNQDMTLVGCDFYVKGDTAASAPPAAPRGLGRFLPRRAEPPAPSGYAFLERTRGWTAAEICVAYALTEPGLATVQVAATALDQLEGLAGATEREMPAGLPAQIEMARFSTGLEAHSA